MPKHFFVDGSNVCYWSSTISMAPILRLLIEIVKMKDTFFCIFDANTPRSLQVANDRAAYDQLVQQFPNCFAEATGGIRADEFILALADKQNATVISNDRFRDFEEKFAWVIDDSGRLAKGQVMGENLIVPSLNIMAHIGLDYVEALNELKSLLPTPKAKAKIGPRIPRPPFKAAVKQKTDVKPKSSILQEEIKPISPAETPPLDDWVDLGPATPTRNVAEDIIAEWKERVRRGEGQ